MFYYTIYSKFSEGLQISFNTKLDIITLLIIGIFNVFHYPNFIQLFSSTNILKLDTSILLNILKIVYSFVVRYGILDGMNTIINQEYYV